LAKEQAQKVLTTKEVAQMLGCTPYKLRVFLRSGKAVDGKYADGKYTRYRWDEDSKELKEILNAFRKHQAAMEAAKAEKEKRGEERARRRIREGGAGRMAGCAREHDRISYTSAGPLTSAERHAAVLTGTSGCEINKLNNAVVREELHGIAL